MRFEELKLTYGYPLQLQATNAAGQPERYSCRLIGCLPGRSILISVPKASGRLMRFRTGQKVVVRFMADNGIGVFISLVDVQTTDPYPILHISYPDNVTFKGIRSATRVPVGLTAHLHNRTHPERAAVSGQIADMSITGARLDMDANVGELGDVLELELQVDINGIRRQLQLTGIIRSRVDGGSTEEQEALGMQSYGLEFVELSEEQRLVLYAFVFGQIVLQDVSSIS